MNFNIKFTFSVVFNMPIYPKDYIYKADLLLNAVLPMRILDAQDYYYIKTGGYEANGRGRGRGRGRGGYSGRVDVQAAGRMIKYVF